MRKAEKRWNLLDWGLLAAVLAVLVGGAWLMRAKPWKRARQEVLYLANRSVRRGNAGGRGTSARRGCGSDGGGRRADRAGSGGCGCPANGADGRRRRVGTVSMP